MSFFDIFRPKLFDDDVCVGYRRSWGLTKSLIPITVADIKRGFVYDETGYKNRVVLELRKD